MHKALHAVLTVCTLLPTVAFAIGASVAAGDTRTEYDTAWSKYSSPSSMVRHVSPNGLDSNDGTSATKAWKTLQTAVQRLGPGMTLYVHAGPYDGPISFSSAVSGTASAPIIIKGALGELKPVIRQSGESSTLFKLTKSYWILDGLELDGRGYAAYLVQIPPGADHVVVRNSLLRNNGKDAFVIGGVKDASVASASNVVAEGNEIRDIVEVGEEIRINITSSDPDGESVSCTSHAQCAAFNAICSLPKGSSSARTCHKHEDGHGFGIISNANNILIHSNRVHEVSGDGLQCSGPAQPWVPGERPYNITLEDNEMFTSPANYGASENALDVKDCDNITARQEYYHGFRSTFGGSSPGSAIVFHYYGNGLLIEDSDIADACGGIATGHSDDDTVRNLVVRRNSFRGIRRSSSGGCPERGHAIRFEKLTGADVFNNSFYDIDYSALTLGTTWPVADVDFWKNSVALSPAGSTWIFAYNPSLISEFESDYNLFFHSDGSTSHLSCNGTRLSLSAWRTSACATTRDPSSFVGDPLYADAASGDLSLQANSPAIDVGLEQPAGLNFCGAGPDIGAHERCEDTAPSNPAVSMLQDAFDDGTLNGTLWKVSNQVGGTVTETSALELAPFANTDATALLVESKALYSLVGSSAYVRTDEVVSSSGNVAQQFSLKQDSNNKVYWAIEGGVLSAKRKMDGNGDTLAQLPYSATDHRWLRLREDGGTIFWDTSADGSSWTNRTSWVVPTGFKPGALTVTFYVETFGGGSPAPGSARYSHLNTTGGTAPPPGVAGIQDDFNDGVLASRWVTSQSGGTVSESGGTLNLAPAANNGSVLLIAQSAEARSLRGSYVLAEVPQVIATSGNLGQRLEVKNGSDKLTWKVENGVLTASVKLSGTTSTKAQATYSPTAHRWWRIRELDGVLYWDTSPDGLTWSQQASVATNSVFAIDAVTIQFYLETWGSGVASPGIAHFDNVNLPPGVATLTP